VELFGINGSELLILGLVAVVVLGPEKLPEYAQKLAQLIKNLRGYAAGAKERLREEVGDEVADMDWRKLDPRQYDPRKIIRDALLDDESSAPSPASPSGSVGAAAVAAAAPAAALSALPTVATQTQLAAGELAPFDSEAT
jgi:sec-independent protein translocase protein TatB